MKIKNKGFKFDYGIFSIIGYLQPIDLIDCGDADKCYIWDIPIVGEAVDYGIIIDIKILWFYTIRIIIK